jgi:hypothetical protein
MGHAKANYIKSMDTSVVVLANKIINAEQLLLLPVLHGESRSVREIINMLLLNW